MNRARSVAAASLAIAGIFLVTACGTSPYADSGAVQPVAVGQQQQPAGAVPAGSTQVKLIASTVDGLGDVLTDEEGHTLYRYAKDLSQPPKATCAAACAETWPPLISDSPALVAGLDQQLVSSVVRADGRTQVTVGGWPVYRYAKDTGSGVAFGQNVSNDWAAITPTGGKATGSASAAAGTDQAPADSQNQDAAAPKPTTVGINTVDGLGQVLTDTTGKTLYLFMKDKGSGTSTCDGTCAATWPPVLVDGRITVAEEVDTTLIGQVRRSDGTMQVTIGGWPVYSYSKDTAPGQANGHGVGGTWYAMEPAGCRVDPGLKPTGSGGTQQAVATTGGY